MNTGGPAENGEDRSLSSPHTVSLAEQVSSTPGGSLLARSRIAVMVFGVYIFVGGTISLFGWILNIRRMADWEGGGLAIQPNASLCTAATGLVLLLLLKNRYRIAGVLGVIVGVIGILTLFENFSGIALGIDSLLTFGRPWGNTGTTAYGRMGTPASVSFSMIGAAAAIAAFAPGWRSMVPKLGLGVVFVASIPFVGYIFGADFLYELPKLTAIAWQTATFLIAAGLGLILLVPEHRPARTLISESGPGMLARRTLPFIIVIPVVIGVLRVYGQNLGYYDTAMGTALFVVLTVTLLIAVLWRGITALSTYEVALRDREVLLSGIVGSITDGLAALDNRWRFTFASDEILRRLDKQRDEVIGKNIAEVAPEFLETDGFRAIERAMVQRVSVEHEYFYEPLGMWLSDRAYPTGDGGLVVSSRNVTERKRAENALRESEVRYRSLFEVSVHGNLIIDESGIIESVNPAVQRLFGYQAAELIGRNVSILMPEPYKSNHDSYIANYLRTGERKIIGIGREVVGKRKDGSEFPIDLAVAEFRIGSKRSFLGSVTDISARKFAEDELLVAKDAAEAANRAKDEFLAVLSHELRSPLNAVYGWMQILMGDSVDASMLRKGLEVVSRNVRHQSAMIEDLLDVSRIISGKMSVLRENIALFSVVQSAVEAMRPLAEKKNLELSVDLDVGEDGVIGDRNRLQQVVTNLLANAIKFTPEGGRISVTVSQTAGRVRIEISDTGVGLTAEQCESIFEPFWQAEGGYKRRHGGLGLGLTIVKNLVALHNGTVCARSKGRGKGSVFTVELPLAAEAKTNAELTASAIGGTPHSRSDILEGLEILIVDDDVDSLEMMRFAIESQGAVVTICSSASQAIDALAKKRFSLMISDIGMAGMDGFDLIAAVRSFVSDSAIQMPAIALSGYVSEMVRERAMLNGFQRHLPKPVDIRKLIAVIRELTTANKEQKTA